MPEPKPPKQSVLTIANVLGGWISDFNPIKYPVAGSPSQYRYSNGMTTMRPGKRGHIAPAELFDGTSVTDTDTNINSLPRAICVNVSIVPPVEPSVITGGASGTAPRVIGLNGMTEVGSVNHTITAPGSDNFTTLPSPGTGYWGEDILYATCVNSSSAYTDYIFYTYNTNENGYIGRYDGVTTYVDDWIIAGSGTGPYDGTTGSANTVALTANVPHRMCVFDAIVAIAITDGQYIDILDCSNAPGLANGVISMGTQSGSLIPAKTFLDIGAGWVATDIVAYQDYVAISCVKTGTNFNQGSAQSRARVILWNGTDLNPTQIYELDDWYVSSLKVVKGQLFAFTSGMNNTTKVMQLPFYPPYFQVVWEAPTSVVGEPPLPNQVTYFNEMIQWVSGSVGAVGTSSYNVYGLLQTQAGWTPHTTYYLSNGVYEAGNYAGFLSNVNANVLYLGASFGGTNKIVGAYGDGESNGSVIKSTGITNSAYVELRTPFIEVGYRFSVVKVRAYFSSFDSTSSMLISLIPNFTPANASSDPISGIDALAWTIDSSTHPNIATTLVASTSELGGRLLTDISGFWMAIRNQNTDTTHTPPILRKLEIIIEETTKP